MTDIQKLKALAEAATPGPWECREVDGLAAICHDHGWIGDNEISDSQDLADSRYIAAANSAAVLELIAEIERLERKNSNQAQTIREYSDLVMGGDVSLGMLRADIRVTTGERDQLKAENERLELENEDTLKKFEEAVEGFAKLSAEVLDLRQQLAVPSDVLADCEAMRLDAERLDWLDTQSRPIVEGQCMGNPEGELTGYDWAVFGQCSTVREAIDDAMSKEAQS